MRGQSVTGQPETVKPFRLVRYFGATSMVAILIFSLVMAGVMGGWSKQALLDTYQEYARILATNLNHQVFRQFVLPTATLYGQIDLSSEFQQRRLDKVVRETIYSLNIDYVNIYDVDGILLYSTEGKEIGQPGDFGVDFPSVAAGSEVTGMISEPSFLDYALNRKLPEKALLRTLTPFRAEQMTGLYGPRPVLGVFELTVDMSSELEQIFKLQALSALTAVGLMAVLTIILILIVRQGERILHRRAEERKELELRLQDNERMASLGRMVASVSHEIKTPLGIIRSTGELLGSQVEEESPSHKLSEVIVEECSRLNRIVTEFLDFARPLEPHPRPCRIEEILERNLEALAPELDKQGVILEKDLPEGPEAQADPDLLYRAFLNVLVNAIQAMAEGGRLNVRVLHPENGRRHRVEVEDTGRGVSAEELERLFEPFFTLKETGSGLGLSIVQSIIKAHGGKISIDSVLGQGTKVTIEI